MRYSSKNNNFQPSLAEISKTYESTRFHFLDPDVNDPWVMRIIETFPGARVIQPKWNRVQVQVVVHKVEISGQSPMARASAIKDADKRFKAYTRGGLP